MTATIASETALAPHPETLGETGAAISTAAGILDAVRNANCSLAVWQRNAILDWSALLEGSPRDIRFETSRAALAPRFTASLADHGFGGRHLHRAFAEDVALLAGRLCAVMQCDSVEVRLEVVTTDSCRKFHADYVAARLITTYVGPGTQWLTREDAARVRSGGEPRRIHQLEPGDVGIFKGKLATEYPAIHRSPPIASAQGKRLLLVLNSLESK
ncbi:DUF1826 domain-containing protein [Erythrobacter sp.]|uniref:DUF1826 domain-containing protein n=1 Tax=Erythrobacter sp. TaxID=1042 RepID=UPI001425E450|nr:DUF1826 domain-containing protein [Erythrobacter sp.]QIQ86711.1 MAG: DUF1826 domain-containing protein [Erythrobacter sp.]